MKTKIAFTGGGTAGHIYPGLAVADELKNLAENNNLDLEIFWLGCSRGMDKKIVESAVRPNGKPSADVFYGIPSGKLRRYFSMKNFLDLFKIAGGFFKSFFILAKMKPALLFSKGGFVSVPPCIAAKLLKIPVFTHECDFTPGLANRINAKSASKMLLSYEETKRFLSEGNKAKAVVTGNPVRPVFYEADFKKGLEFLGIPENHEKPVLMVLGGSSGAKQINGLVSETLDFLCRHFIVVHQTGMLNTDEEESRRLKEKYGDDYKPYAFIYKEMADVLSAADVILSRAGANSIWECAVMHKPMVLVPLCGNGTRGDQVDNAKFFEEKGCAEVLLGKDATGENTMKALEKLLTKEERTKYEENLKALTGSERPAKKIADLIVEQIMEISK
ncbi:MAG: undecaprenyldiphospho-muramoylpentapeptide beta-N-acetylglucosaminyltransferase [Treponema sp.]|nr:undecaprenyldiphospho-muramoylpentapeptide beta-N-acetylglucosaminyltransferase [Treponema sp.]